MGTWRPCKTSPSFYEHFLLWWSLNTSRMASLWHLMWLQAHFGNQLIDFSCLSCRLYIISGLTICLKDNLMWPSFTQLYSRMVARFIDGERIIKSAGGLWLCRSYHVSPLICECRLARLVVGDYSGFMNL